MTDNLAPGCAIRISAPKAICSPTPKAKITPKKEKEEEEGRRKKAKDEDVDENGRALRKKKRVSYRIEENDSKYIRDLERGVRPDEPTWRQMAVSVSAHASMIGVQYSRS